MAIQHDSKVKPHREHPQRFVVWIEHVSGQVHPFEREAHEQTALDITVALVEACALRHEAEAEPFHRCQRQLRPVVEEAIRRMARVEDILALAVEFELPPTQRTLVARGNSSGFAKYAA